MVAASLAGLQSQAVGVAGVLHNSVSSNKDGKAMFSFAYKVITLVFVEWIFLNLNLCVFTWWYVWEHVQW